VFRVAKKSEISKFKILCPQLISSPAIKKKKNENIKYTEKSMYFFFFKKLYAIKKASKDESK
jgi:hypothetical protein